jgi:beta-glucosidase
MAGQEVVQLYVADPVASLPRPPKELKAFAKVALQPDESQTVRFTLDERALSFYDPVKGDWVAEAGEFVLMVGSSSMDIRSEARVELV